MGRTKEQRLERRIRFYQYLAKHPLRALRAAQLQRIITPTGTPEGYATHYENTAAALQQSVDIKRQILQRRQKTTARA